MPKLADDEMLMLYDDDGNLIGAVGKVAYEFLLNLKPEPKTEPSPLEKLLPRSFGPERR